MKNPKNGTGKEKTEGPEAGKVDEGLEPRQPQVILDYVAPLSPRDKALIETGKDILKGSLDTARGFCKFMITVSAGAIPIYLGLLGFLLPENAVLPQAVRVFAFIPPVLFLTSMILFILGYLPRAREFSLDMMEEIEAVHDALVKARWRYIVSGTIVFLSGVGLSILILLIQVVL